MRLALLWISMRLSLLALCVGCGRIGFDAGGGPPGDVSPLICPEAYARLGSSCYRVVNQTANEVAFIEAEQLCEADGVGAHLAVVDDADEQQRLFEFAGVTGVRVGTVDRRVEGDYVTVVGTKATFLPFAPNEPDGDNDDCTDLRIDGMHDADCAQKDDYICEFDGIPADPSAF